VDAKERGLLVLAEAWYPGWRAEVDGQPASCVPANIWMRAVPVPSGKHQVRVYFRQNYLVAGLVVSIVSAGLLVAVALGLGKRVAPAPGPSAGGAVEPRLQAAPRADASGRTRQKAGRVTGRSEPVSGSGRVMRVCAAGVLLACVVTLTEIPRWRGFQSEKLSVEAEAQCYLGISLHAQRQIRQAIAQYQETLRLKPDHVMALCKLAWVRAAYPQPGFRDGTEAVRLAQRACELTQSQAPAPLETLAAAYAEAGRFDDAVAIAEKARQLAVAAGQPELAERPLKMLKVFAERKPWREADRD
jgi:tetratricopeptide (TPR) repeat protein